VLRGVTPTADLSVFDPPAPGGTALELVAKFFRALGDPTRLDLLVFLAGRGEATGSECVERAGLSQGRVSAHLACLVSCGLVTMSRHGRYAYYKVTDERVSELVAVGTDMTAEHAASIAACLKVAASRS
jgi:DNA-binding transcriptional ArsR family regulator